MNLINVTSFLPEISILILLILISVYRFFEVRNKKLYSYTLVSGLIIIFLLIIQQFLYCRHLYMYDTAAYDSFGSIIKITSLIGFVSCLLIPGDKKLFADSKAIIYNSVLLFSVFISITSYNLLLTYCSFELLSFSYFTILKTSTRTKAGSLKLSSFYASWIISSSLMLFGISLFYGLFGSLNYNLISEFLLLNQVNKLILAISLIFIFSGFAVKLFSFPLQSIITDVFIILSIDKISIILITSIIAGSGAFIRFYYSVFNGTNANHFNWELFIVIFFTFNILTSAFILYLQKEFLPAIIYMIFINIPFLFISVLCIYDKAFINYLLLINNNRYNQQC